MSVVLLDANVLVYASSHDDDQRNVDARILLAAMDSRRVAVSTQVLSEYANVMTHPMKKAQAPHVIATAVRKLTIDYRVVQVTPETVVRALKARDRWQLSYYDAQIWASAALASIPVVLSEDFSDGLELGPVRFVNPFSDGFDVASILG